MPRNGSPISHRRPFARKPGYVSVSGLFQSIRISDCGGDSHYDPQTRRSLIDIQAIGLWVSIALYNVYFHPLRSYPGPWLARATWLYNAYFTTRGKMPAQTHHLHLTYGEVVRIAPNALTFNTAQAWEEIYGRRK